MTTAQQATSGSTRTRGQGNNGTGAAAAKTPRGPSPDRKRFSFGPVWNAAVIAGKVTDHDKLIAQAVKLKIAAKSDAKRLKFATLLQKVQAKLQEMPENERPADDGPHTKQGKEKVEAEKTSKKSAATAEEQAPAEVKEAASEKTEAEPKADDKKEENGNGAEKVEAAQ